MYKLSIAAGAAAGSAIFCILLERLNFFGIFWGATAGAAALILLKSGKKHRGRLAFGLWMPVYFLRLLLAMAESSFRLICLILNPRAPSVSVTGVPAAVGEQARVLVSNSISLTPGTLTIEETPESYTVLSMFPPGRRPANPAAQFELHIKEKKEETDD